MEVLQLQDEKEIWLYTPKKPYELAWLAGQLQGAACILIVDDQKISIDRKNQISMDIVFSGCEWVACLGYDGSDWDDRLDWSYLESIDYDVSFDEVLLTSWHDDETLDDVLELLLSCAARNDEPFGKVAVILLGSDNYSVAGIKQAITDLLKRWAN